eukprot:1268361-Amphidinium_carterae.1
MEDVPSSRAHCGKNPGVPGIASTGSDLAVDRENAGCFLESTRNRGRVFGVPGIASIGIDLAEDRENAFDEPDSSID